MRGTYDYWILPGDPGYYDAARRILLIRRSFVKRWRARSKAADENCFSFWRIL